jgi:hypothetical protein
MRAPSVWDQPRCIVARHVIVVATIDIGGHDRGAGSDRRTQTIVTEPEGHPFHRNAEFVGNADKLFPKHGRKLGEHSLFSLDIEPPQKFGRLLAKESSLFRRHGEQSSLRTADLVWRASALNNAHAEWL